MKLENIECNEVPHIGSKLISSPGLYKFVWANKHSWFTSKHLRFRISVLVPYHKITSTEKDLHKVIEVICDDGVSGSAKNVLEVGVVCRQKNVLIYSKDLIEEIPDLDVLAINGFVTRAKKDKKYSSVKIGIVARIPKKRNELKTLEAVCMSRDVDAVALLNQFELHSNTLICVMQEDGLRSCVVNRGKIMVDSDGLPIADLFRAGINDAFVGISTLLSLFGPGVVVVCGKEIPGVEEILERIKDLVPAGILQSSVIKNTAFGEEASAIAASKLHHLNFKFRINT